ncbi:MAG: ATP-binding protein [Gemmatimonadaceae bacterium]
MTPQLAARQRISATLASPETRLSLVAGGFMVALVLLKQWWAATSEWSLAFDWLTYLPLHLAAAILLGRAASATRLNRRAARAWRLFQLSEVVMIVVVLASAIVHAVGLPKQQQSWIWYIGVLSYPPFVAGLLTFPVATRERSPFTRSQILGAVVLVVGLALGWFFVLRPLLAMPAGGTATYLEVAWSSIGDLFPLAALTVLLLRGTLPVHRSAIFIVTAAQLISACGDLLTTELALRGQYQTSSPLDAVWYAASLLMAVAGAYQAVLERDANDAHPERSLESLLVLRGLVYGSIIVAYAVMLRASASVLATPAGGYLLVAATLTGLLVVLPAVAFRDTERAVRERKSQEARFAALIEHSSDLVFVVDSRGQMTFITPSVCRTLGGTEQEIVGTNFSLYLHPDDRHALEAQPLAVLARRAGQPVRWRMHRADSSWVTIDALVQDRLGDSVIDGFVINGRDVTAQVALEEQARHAQKMEVVGRLAGGIAHDFNNVLTVIRGFAGLARGRRDNPAPLNAELDEIDRAVERAADLTRRILAFSRNREPQLERLDLNVVVAEMESMLRRIVAKEVTLRLCIGNAEAWVDADAGYVEQIVLNLALNARDAMPDGGVMEVRVQVDQPAREIRLVVKDTGTGIAPEIRSRIFEPFFTTKALGAGSGLGLAMVAAIVEDLHGRIEVDTESGVGTSFAVAFPQQAGLEPSVIPATHLRPGVGGGEKILVVDDDEAIASTLRTYFTRLGYHVRVAAHGRQALASLSQDGPVDLVLTDLAMPGMNGRQLVHYLRIANPDAKIICMSGYADYDDTFGDTNPDLPFISKPFALDELGATVRRVLASA